MFQTLSLLMSGLMHMEQRKILLSPISTCPIPGHKRIQTLFLNVQKNGKFQTVYAYSPSASEDSRLSPPVFKVSSLPTTNPFQPLLSRGTNDPEKGKMRQRSWDVGMKATQMMNKNSMDASRCAVSAWGSYNAERWPWLRTDGGGRCRGSGESDLHAGL